MVPTDRPSNARRPFRLRLGPWAVLTVCAVGGARVARAEAGVEPVEFTWREVRATLDGQPAWGGAQQRAAAVRAVIDAAGAVPNPSVEASAALGQGRGGRRSGAEWGVGLSLPLGWTAQRSVKLRLARAEAGVADAEAHAVRQELLLQLRLWFWLLVYAQEQVATLTELAEQAAALTAMVGRRVASGEARPIEALRAELEAERMAGELAEAIANLGARRAQLGLWLGVGTGQQVVAVAEMMALPQATPAAPARAAARERHPKVAIAAQRLEALAAGLSVARRARLPDLALQAFVDHDLERDAYGVSLAFDLPLWNWNAGDIRRAEAELAGGELQLEAERRELETAVIAAEAACQASIARAERYRDRIQPRASEVARTSARAYSVGEASLLEVIDTRRAELESRSALLAAFVQAQLECSQLAALSGEELL